MKIWKIAIEFQSILKIKPDSGIFIYLKYSNLQDSETAQSSYQSQQQVGFAQIKAFDQDVIVKERDEQITGLNDKAVAINSLGKVINLKIHEQDEKLDIMADNTNQADDNIGDAVKELDEAATISKKGCGKCWWYMIALGLLLTIIIILVCVYT